MNKYTETFNNAVNLYHDHNIEEAFKLFSQLGKKESDKNQRAKLDIWLASCELRQNQIEKAQRIIHSVLKDKEIDTYQKKRALRVQADIHLSKDEFEKTFEIYDQLLDTEDDWIEIEHLSHLISMAEDEYQYFKDYGSKKDWKAELKEKVKKILDSIRSA